VGSIVYFPQGTYTFTNADGVAKSNMDRFHQGRITRIEVSSGTRLYHGEHTMDDTDGKHIGYSAYSKSFKCQLEQLRVCSNLLDLLGSGGGGGGASAGQKYDVYLSAARVDVEAAPHLGHEHAADLNALADNLRQAGLAVFMDSSNGMDTSTIMSALRSSKVIVACLSNAYADADATLMELQYVKKTLRKNTVPIIVGDQSESWDFMTSLVGMLIAGDLYVDFRLRGKHEAKVAELLHTVKGLVDAEASGEGGGPGKSRLVSKAGDPPRDVFMSYCWVRRARPRPCAPSSSCA
jgi:hypothetical protein